MHIAHTPSPSEVPIPTTPSSHYVLIPKCCLTRRVHEVKMHKVIDAELLKLQDNSAKVGPEDFWIRVLLHLSLIGLLCSVRVNMALQK